MRTVPYDLQVLGDSITLATDLDNARTTLPLATAQQYRVGRKHEVACVSFYTSFFWICYFKITFSLTNFAKNL